MGPGAYRTHAIPIDSKMSFDRERVRIEPNLSWCCIAEWKTDFPQQDMEYHGTVTYGTTVYQQNQLQVILMNILLKVMTIKSGLPAFRRSDKKSDIIQTQIKDQV